MTIAPVRPIVFWALGLLNNVSYVIMLASAKQISEGGTALVFLANVIPSLFVKLSAPYWFDRISYDTRLSVATAFMGASFLVVALFQASTSPLALYFQLLGVALASAQSGLGEASLLALAGACDASRAKPACLSCFSSGTGVAGVFGFFYTFLLNDLLGLSLPITLVLATLLAAMYFGVYNRYLWGYKGMNCRVIRMSNLGEYIRTTSSPLEDDDQLMDESDHPEGIDVFHDESMPPLLKIHEMTTFQRLILTFSLYPYMIPLFVVYAAEYTMQSGTWTAIGFPITSETARSDFYFAANWAYQAGVFVSRSSGTLFTAPLWFIWLMPALQVLNVAIFWVVAVHHVLYSWWLLVGCFYVGLLGGAVYVHVFTRICVDVPAYTEFALSATSVAADIGVVAADVMGVFIQSCLYAINGLQGAAVTCPIKFG